uniref:PH domain-containing protein n=1 Tax=Chromera velia CCMP2878 TaxID=1169474 RepID=A0A0G4IAR9_9ALVE|eukprot:Cvel_12631.t1-p1 / transcript=Cvel_12631.t1 / gene=Cvel_12631 / organism=Chromera_velia_CCMP2878 / gene_product=hypothetical protein / transcript_product=hypothetical protein / location=Cvel_scaffold833:53894-62748(-) / protein_length=1064 / sequence_SO=supercontig / SO=protein_coding / is_pseudo=false
MSFSPEESHRRAAREDLPPGLCRQCKRLAMLKRGFWVYKHAYKKLLLGNRRAKFLQLDDSLTTLTWYPAADDKGKPAGRGRSVELKEMEGVVFGCGTFTFKFMRGQKPPPWLCFSVVHPERTFDFSVISREAAEVCLLGLQNLLLRPELKFQNPLKLLPLSLGDFLWMSAKFRLRTLADEEGMPGHTMMWVLIMQTMLRAGGIERLSLLRFSKFWQKAMKLKPNDLPVEYRNLPFRVQRVDEIISRTWLQQPAAATSKALLFLKKGNNKGGTSDQEDRLQKTQENASFQLAQSAASHPPSPEGKPSRPSLIASDGLKERESISVPLSPERPARAAAAGGAAAGSTTSLQVPSSRESPQPHTFSVLASQKASASLSPTSLRQNVSSPVPILSVPTKPQQPLARSNSPGKARRQGSSRRSLERPQGPLPVSVSSQRMHVQANLSSRLNLSKSARTDLMNDFGISRRKAGPAAGPGSSSTLWRPTGGPGGPRHGSTRTLASEKRPSAGAGALQTLEDGAVMVVSAHDSGKERDKEREGGGGGLRETLVDSNSHLRLPLNQSGSRVDLRQSSSRSEIEGEKGGAGSNRKFRLKRQDTFTMEQQPHVPPKVTGEAVTAFHMKGTSAPARSLTQQLEADVLLDNLLGDVPTSPKAGGVGGGGGAGSVAGRDSSPADDRGEKAQPKKGKSVLRRESDPLSQGGGLLMSPPNSSSPPTQNPKEERRRSRDPSDQKGRRRSKDKDRTGGTEQQGLGQGQGMSRRRSSLLFEPLAEDAKSAVAADFAADIFAVPNPNATVEAVHGTRRASFGARIVAHLTNQESPTDSRSPSRHRQLHQGTEGEGYRRGSTHAGGKERDTRRSSTEHKGAGRERRRSSVGGKRDGKERAKTEGGAAEGGMSAKPAAVSAEAEATLRRAMTRRQQQHSAGEGVGSRGSSPSRGRDGERRPGGRVGAGSQEMLEEAPVSADSPIGRRGEEERALVAVSPPPEDASGAPALPPSVRKNGRTGLQPSSWEGMGKEGGPSSDLDGGGATRNRPLEGEGERGEGFEGDKKERDRGGNRVVQGDGFRGKER